MVTVQSAQNMQRGGRALQTGDVLIVIRASSQTLIVLGTRDADFRQMTSKREVAMS